MIKLDFIGDYRRYVENQLSALGVKWKGQPKDEEVIRRYFDQKRRRVSCDKRAVHESIELVIPSEHEEDYRVLRN